MTVSDQGEPPLTYETRVYIKILDDNDNRPMFNERSYYIEVPETSFMGLDIPLFQVLAYDNDEGPNGEISFDVKKDEAAIFNIDEQTGVIYASGDLVYGELHTFSVSTWITTLAGYLSTWPYMNISFYEIFTFLLNQPKLTAYLCVFDESYFRWNILYQFDNKESLFLKVWRE